GQAAARQAARIGGPQSRLPAAAVRHTLALTFARQAAVQRRRGEGQMNAPVRTTVNGGLIAMIVAVATIGGLLFGYDSGAVNGTQSGLTMEFGLSDWSLAWTVGSLLLGCAAGAFFAGRLADAIGR